MSDIIYKYSQLSSKLPYNRSEHKQINSIHYGQAKLLFSEILFLTKYYDENALVLYVGAAGGKHIPYLSDLFPKLHFHLYDPSKFDIEETDKIRIFNKKFTDEIATKYSNEMVLFISDIRTYENLKTADREEYNEIILRDMSWQMSWVNIIKPIAASLKFKLITKAGRTEYFDGTIYLQPYNRMSAETRLFVTDFEKRKSYDNVEFDEKNVYFNWVIRIKFRSDYFDKIMKKYSIKNNWDNSMALFIMLFYCQKFKCDESTGSIGPIEKFIFIGKLFVDDKFLLVKN